VQVVVDPAYATNAVADLAPLLDSYSFTPGNRYAEWKEGDEVAAYGLTALVAGGAGAALAKSGLLGKLWKFVVVGVIGLLSGLKALFSRKETTNEAGK